MIKQLIIIGCGVIFSPFVFFHHLIIGRKSNLWLFGSWRGEKFSDNSKALYEYVLKNEKDIHPIWITKNKKVYESLKTKHYPVMMNSSLKATYYMLRAGFCCGSLSATTDVFGSRPG